MYSCKSCITEAIIFQEAAMKEVYTAASDGNEDLLKKCIADATNVNGYKDEVRS